MCVNGPLYVFACHAATFDFRATSSTGPAGHGGPATAIDLFHRT